MKQADPGVLRLMEQIGGGFTGALAIAWRRADLTNQARLMQAFGDLYAEYERMHEMSKPAE